MGVTKKKSKMGVPTRANSSAIRENVIDKLQTSDDLPKVPKLGPKDEYDSEPEPEVQVVFEDLPNEKKWRRRDFCCLGCLGGWYCARCVWREPCCFLYLFFCCEEAMDWEVTDGKIQEDDKHIDDDWGSDGHKEGEACYEPLNQGKDGIRLPAMALVPGVPGTAPVYSIPIQQMDGPRTAPQPALPVSPQNPVVSTPVMEKKADVVL
eukprot:Hpha_TRINITY_DN11974_c0_g1::TRINITY_DN11974_c0_g1_i1::g.20823::m.20823